VIDVARIEEKIDRIAAGNTAVAMNFGGVQFQNMGEVMEFAKILSIGEESVPPHLRGKPGVCLGILTKALRYGFDPYSLAEHSFLTVKRQKDANDRWQEVATIAYDSFVISAVINAHAPITGRLQYRFEGEGDERKCIVWAKTRDGEVKEHVSPTLGAIKQMRGKNDKGEIRGSPLWGSPKSDNQLAYDTRRDFCRLHFPEILLGWQDKDDDTEPHRGPARAKDVTPADTLKSRLPGPGKASGGFSGVKVEEVAAAPEPEKRKRKLPEPVAEEIKPKPEPESPSPVESQEPAGPSPLD
jgi:hypothetical protein